jgi:hypothetical protein
MVFAKVEADSSSPASRLQPGPFMDFTHHLFRGSYRYDFALVPKPEND